MIDFNPTEEQTTILDMASAGNLMITARAGCGKTSTLKLIDRAVLPDQPHLLVCFNKEIAKQAQREVRETTVVRTFNSLGHRVWAQYCPEKLVLVPEKIFNIFKSIVESEPKSQRGELWELLDLARHGADLARALGYIPPGHAKAAASLISREDFHASLDEVPSAEAAALIDKILVRSIYEAYNGLIDFADQLYMPTLFGGLWPSYPLVLIDEYQDLSPINQAAVAKLCCNSRQIGVGDDAQAIYAFRGAYSDSMVRAIEKFSMAQAKLTLSFRCPSAIVENVWWRCPDMRAAKQGGAVYPFHQGDLLDGAAVICRNNAPLLALAMKLLAKGRKVSVAGIDISARLLRTMRKLGPEELPRLQLLGAIDAWEDTKTAAKSKSAKDMADAMRVFTRATKTLGQALAYAEHLFARPGGELTFYTGHKAKGLEFDHVYFLDKDLLRDNGQDPNLKYVIETRARETLTYINSGSLG